MRYAATALVLAACALAAPARAEFQKIEDERTFRAIVAGKTLKRPLIRLQVRPEGTIKGRGAAWDVTGQWNWRGGYFCREMNWRDRDIAYNCQEVRVQGDRIRFTSDRGQGDYADFRLTGE